MKLLKKIQTWPPEKKKKASIIFTIFAMLVVVAVWILFFNNFSGKNFAGGSFFGNLRQSFNEIIKSAKK